MANIKIKNSEESMANVDLKRILCEILRNKEQLSLLLDYFKADDIENGILSVPEDLVNKDLHTFLLSKGSPTLTDYFVQFHGDSIHLLVDLNLKQIGPVNLRYVFTVEDFNFAQNNHSLGFSYKEEARSKGNLLQNMALKAMSLKGTCAKLASEYIKYPYLTIDDRCITLQLDNFSGIRKLPENLSLSYVSSKDGALKLRFDI